MATTAESEAQNMESQMKFVIVNFKSAWLSCGVRAILTGAMVNTVDKYKPYRLIGKPRQISKTGKLSICRQNDYETIVRSVKKRFAGRHPKVLALVKRGITCKSEHVTISAPCIAKYLHADDKEPVIVFWNGHIDKQLFVQFKIPQVTKFLNITTVRTKHRSYCLTLTDITEENHRDIFSMPLGYYNRRNFKEYLNLKECHTLICKFKHNDEKSNYHDPCTYVLYTRCIFNYLIDKMKPNKLYTYFGEKF